MKRRKSEAALPPEFHPSVAALEEDIRRAHDASGPYKYAVVDQLFQDAFLEKAREDILTIAFTEKETDIYRVFQTGDLTNLSGLPEDEKAQLARLLRLRDALYSREFRSYIERVTGCGPLSGTKTDMSCNEYNKGCYLLNHDDVIGTRRVSFILYLPLNEPQWDPRWGGSLELYPVDGASGLNVPVCKPTRIEAPLWNRFIFFKVQPGHSFHSVEEVVVNGDGANGGVGARLSLSGWFHAPVEGEPGYDASAADANAPQSSLQQLYAATLQEPVHYDGEPPVLPVALGAPETKVLEELINPVYLGSAAIQKLAAAFESESVVSVVDVLRHDVAVQLEDDIRAADSRMNENRRGALMNGQPVDLIPPHTSGEHDGWSLVGPPHLQRYSTYKTGAENVALDGPTTALRRTGETLARIEALFRSGAFRMWLAAVTTVVPLSHTTAVRRFRPGLDYTLARGEPSSGEYTLDVVLALTPDASRREWDGRSGGWDVWLAADEDSDEATYGSSDSGVLMAKEPSFNELHIVLRDPGVLKFTKYLQSALPSCRYDVAGEWLVKIEDE